MTFHIQTSPQTTQACHYITLIMRFTFFTFVLALFSLKMAAALQEQHLENTVTDFEVCGEGTLQFTGVRIDVSANKVDAVLSFTPTETIEEAVPDSIKLLISVYRKSVLGKFKV